MKTVYTVIKPSKLEEYGFKKDGMRFVFGTSTSNNTYCGFSTHYRLHAHLGCKANKQVIDKMIADGIVKIEKIDPMAEYKYGYNWNQDMFETTMKLAKAYGEDAINAVFKCYLKAGFVWERSSVNDERVRKQCANYVSWELAARYLYTMSLNPCVQAVISTLAVAGGR